MPSGYTNGILTGETSTFQDFAKKCMRAFGATIHMREENMDKEYTPRVPSSYHENKIKENQKDLKKWESISDDEILNLELSNISKSIEYHEQRIIEIALNSEKINNILQKVNEWIPPTEEHIGIKDFMIQQLTDTLRHDCDDSYHIEGLAEYKDKLDTFKVEDVRQEHILEFEKAIIYHTKQLDKEIDRCEKSNKWVEELINSLQTSK